MPGKKMMGYEEGGDVRRKGVLEEKAKTEKAKKAKGKAGKPKKKELKFSADDGGSISGPISPSRKKVLEQMEATNKKPTPSMMPTAKNNTMPPKPQAPAAPAGAPPAGGMGAPPAGGMGMPPKKPMGMPGMKAGGKVKKKAKSKSYGHGGKVRGAGIAKKGVRKCKMR
jgi:hypothetical protein